MMTGMALGAGSEVGHMAVKAMTGGSGGGGHGEAQQEGGQQQQQMNQGQGQAQEQYGQQEQYQQDPCQGHNMSFVNCLKQNTESVGMCQDYMNMLQSCQKDQSMQG